MNADELTEVEVTVWIQAPNDDGESSWLWEGVTADGQRVVTFKVESAESLRMRDALIKFRHDGGPELPPRMMSADDFVSVERLDD